MVVVSKLKNKINKNNENIFNNIEENEINKIKNIFSQYIEKPTIFKNKNVLTANFIPKKISHRENEINQIKHALAPILKGYNSNNIFLYGTCGTGKTICTKFVVSHLEQICKEKNIKLKTIYINCKMKKVADTEYRLFAQLVRELGEEVPDTGLPTDVLYRKFFNKIENLNQKFLIILDEIDTLIKKVGDEFLYNLTRYENKNSHINIIGITNDLSIKDVLDMRVKSSLGEEDMIFSPYNATQLKDILSERVEHGFLENSVDTTTLNKCSALAAQEHGDARRALDLLRVAGEIAERNNETNIREIHIDMAEDKIDMDRILQAIKSQPKQSQAVLYSIITIYNKTKQNSFIDNRLLTGDVFIEYNKLCIRNNMRSLTQRRLSDLITELDMLGIINANVISKGRYGRTREISLGVSQNILERINSFLMRKFK